MRINDSPYARTLYIWNSVSALFFFSRITPLHSHNTLQLVFDLRNEFRCRLKNGPWVNYKSAIIKEQAIHQLDTNGSIQLIIYLDTGSDISRSIKSAYLRDRDISPIGMNISDHINLQELQRCLVKGDQALLEKIIMQLLSSMGTAKNQKQVDERISIIVQCLSTDEISEARISLLARKVSLSESRLRSLFKDVVGVSLHRYILWNRVMAGINAILNGSTVAEAALDCGFQDSSHFHKVLLKMFGVTPSQFINQSKKVQSVICAPYPLQFETRVPNHADDKEEIYRI